MAQADAGPTDNGGNYLPDDPEYTFDAAYRGEDVLAHWIASVGPLQPHQAQAARSALIECHRYCRRSPRELLALAVHIGRDKRAREWWGTGRSPSTWMLVRDSGERQWQVIRAHWLSNGGKLTTPFLAPAEVVARAPGRHIPPPPPYDRTCPGVGRGCNNGHVRDRNRLRVPCPECALGHWMRDYDTSPEVLAKMDLT